MGCYMARTPFSQAVIDRIAAWPMNHAMCRVDFDDLVKLHGAHATAITGMFYNFKHRKILALSHLRPVPNSKPMSVYVKIDEPEPPTPVAVPFNLEIKGVFADIVGKPRVSKATPRHVKGVLNK